MSSVVKIGFDSKLLNCQECLRAVRYGQMRNGALANSAYVAGRGELLDWLNDLLGIHYAKVEEASNGAAFCQIFDALHPGKVKLQKVNFRARTEPEMIANYKVLQEVFNSQRIPRTLPVETLIKGRYMAALEMLQWMKGYFDQMFSGGHYDGQARREQVGIPDPGEGSKPVRRTVDQNKVVRNHTAVTPARTPAEQRAPVSTVTRARRQFVPIPPGTVSKTQTAQIEKVKEELVTVKKANQNLLDERNFYYGKLQKMEVICQGHSDDFAVEILKVLYETDEEHGFVSPDELDI
jgi:RP/EB family microtubule-associated protein